MRIAKLILALAALAFLTACIISNTRHTLYLDPDGSVEWVVLQTDIRASTDDPAKREREEAEFLEAARRMDHPVAAGLRELGAGDVDSRILRERRPYTIETTARFPAVAEMFEEFFGALDLENETSFTREAGHRTLTLRLFGIDQDGEIELEDEDDPILGLLDSDLNLVLTRGSIVDATGFVTTDYDDTVVLSWEALEDLVDEDGTVTLSLTWKVD